jgi:hypothetical protein
VPGLSASEHYEVRIKADGEWQSAFVWQTGCKTEKPYFEHLAGWTHSYLNFEMSGAVEVEIARANGQPIRKATVHPKRHASTCNVIDGKVIVKLGKPCLVAIDIDGQMDDQDTGKGYKGPPIHTISLFANPTLKNKPTPGDAGVFSVKPGEKPPTEGDWSTLYFLPGVHDIGLGYRLRPNCQYYIPGDARTAPDAR